MPSTNPNVLVAAALNPLTRVGFNGRVKLFYNDPKIMKPFSNCYEDRFNSGWYSFFNDHYNNFGTDALCYNTYGKEFQRRDGWAYGYAYEAVDVVRRGNMDYGFVVMGEVGRKGEGTRLARGKVDSLPFNAEYLDRLALHVPTMATETLAQSFEEQLEAVQKWRVREDRDIMSEEDRLSVPKMIDCMDPVDRILYITLAPSQPFDLYAHGKQTHVEPVEYEGFFRPGSLIIAHVSPVNWTAGSKKVRALMALSIHLLAASPEGAEVHGRIGDIANRFCSVHLDVRNTT